MLALLGFLTVATLFVLIVSRLASPLVALIAVPIAAALAGGFGLATAKFIVTGLQQIAPVAAMFVFAILYFGIMIDAGLFDPVALVAVGRPHLGVEGGAPAQIVGHVRLVPVDAWSAGDRVARDQAERHDRGEDEELAPPGHLAMVAPFRRRDRRSHGRGRTPPTGI